MPQNETDLFQSTSNRPALLTLFAIVFIDILGYTLVLPLLPFYAEQLGASPFAVGSIVAVFGLCQLISGPILGRLSDRFGRKPILIISQIGTCLGFVMLAQANILWMVFLARIVDGITAGNIVVAQAYVADTTTPKERTRAMGLIGAAFGLGFVLGPAVSGLLVSYSHAAPIWVAAALSAITILSSIFVLKETVQKGVQRPPPGPGEIRSYKIVFQNRGLFVCLCAYFLFCMAFGLFTTGLALFAERLLIWNGHPFGAREVGYVLALSGFATLITQVFIVGRAVKKLGERRMAWIGFTGLAIGVTLCGLTTIIGSVLPIFIVGTIIHSISAGFVRPSLNGLISQSVSPRIQGFVFGIAQTVLSTANIIAPLIAGLIIQMHSYYAWGVLAAVISVTGAYLVRTSTSIPMIGKTGTP